ncbi:unnamed protein product [Rodentolepis nana]|uniref:APOBEC1 complementation factor n=1 Tax=Rodentolepis nana TaxID=102285 RepID=A0A0R3T808_RODNA|nr:unnamed protein product [Rodentolepis nana]
MVEVEKLWKNCLLDTYDENDESDYCSDSNEYEVTIPNPSLQCSNNNQSSPINSESLNLPKNTAIPWTQPISSPTLPIQSQQNNQIAVVLSREETLVRLIERTHYPIMQENGQRRYGPPPDWVGPAPARGCEIFIGKIPRDCFEDELVPVFETVGKIYMFRLMMDFSGCNRGYGFCIYTNRDDTRKAVQKLDGYEIRKSKALGVCFSVDNCRLFVGGIPKTKTKEEIYIEMSKVTEGVRDVIVYPSVVDKTRNRGFAFVEYENHKAAAMARRKLIPGRIHLWGHQVAIDWAEPEREVDEDVMSKVRILYVRNLMLHTTEEALRDQFNLAAGFKNAVERVKKMKDYAFIHFTDRTLAANALAVMNGYYLDGSRIEVSWAKPADKTEALRRSLDQGGLLSLLKNIPTDSFNSNALSLQFQQQQSQQQLLLNSLMRNTDGARSSGISENDSLNPFRDCIPQNSNERILRDALTLSRILGDSTGINVNKPQISTNMQLLRNEQPSTTPQQINDYMQYQKQPEKEGDRLQRILAELNARIQLERQRQILSFQGQHLVDQTFCQGDLFTNTNNLTSVLNRLTSRPQVHQPMSIGIQGQQSVWPNLTAIQSRAQQQVNQNHFYSDSYRPMLFNTATPNMDKPNRMNTLEIPLNKAPLNQALTQMSCVDNLGSESIMKCDRNYCNYGQTDLPITTNLNSNFDFTNNQFFKNDYNKINQLAPSTYREVSPNLFSNSQPQLSLIERLRRRQAALQDLPKDLYETLPPQTPQGPEDQFFDEPNTPSIFSKINHLFEFTNDPFSMGFRETMSNSSIDVPDLKFSVDKLIMDDEQKFPPSNALI